MKRIVLIIFTLCTLPIYAQLRDTYSETWVAVDDLNRASPDYSITGNVKTGKTVGLFYYIWLEEIPAWPIKDISKILAGQDTWGSAPAFHHCGESLYGYYSSGDEFVIRKHIQMFVDAGVDYLFLDNTNANNYLAVQNKIFTVLRSMKNAGYDVPKISWAVYNGNVTLQVESLYDNIATKAEYQDLIFNWNGKPLLLGSYNGTRQEIKDYFTFKKSWAWASQPWFTETGGKDRWPWLEDYPQKPGLNSSGQVEQISVAAAHHPHGPHAIGKSTGADRTQAPILGTDGKYFALQWERALEVDPPMIMVTQWNEWIAQRFIKNDPQWHQPIDYMARQWLPSGGSQFVDLYTPEYSRDLEPMRTGYRDNMYLQLANNIRKYKGVRPYRQEANPIAIELNSAFSQWTNVGPLYRDDVEDVMHRNHKSFGSDLTYTNTTGRNDFEGMKVSYDPTYLYFYVYTKENITAHTSARWMNLLLNTDANYGTGWEGYDYIVNHTVNSSMSTTLKKNSGGTFSWSNLENVSYTYSGREMHIRIPAASLGINTANPFILDFKWVDNSLQANDIIDLYVNGDAAPNNRYNYRYIGKGTGKLAWEFNQSGNMEGWSMANNVSGAANGYTLATTVTGADPYILSPGGLGASSTQYPYIYLRMRNTSTQSTGELYWTTNLSPAFDGTKRVSVNLPANDGEYHDVLIDLSAHPAWANTITQIRIDPIASGSSGEIRYDHISFEQINRMDCNHVWEGTSVPVNPAISIALTSGTNPSCANTSLTFTASISNGGANPSYQWKVDGVNAGTNSATFTTTTLANADIITCTLSSNAVCATSTTVGSNSITLTRHSIKTPAVSIALTSGTNPSCAGSSLTFTATPTNGGTAPVYQWKVNGTNAGTNSAIFTSSTLTNSSIVSCVLTSNLACVSSSTATSNNISVTRTANVTPAVSIAITSGSNPGCAGSSLTFTANPTNGGTAPVYQWKVNGTNAGTNSATFTSSTLANSSIVSCMMTSNLICVTSSTATSNSIIVTRTPNVTPAISIAITSGSNPGCAGSSLTFTATPTNGGTAPVYQWKVNGVNTGTNNKTYSFIPTNGDQVSVSMTSSSVCNTTSTVSSNTITLTVNSIPVADAGEDQFITTSSTDLSGNAPMSGAAGSWTTTGTAVIISPSDPFSTVSNLTSGAHTFKWTINNGACSAFDEVTINHGSSPVISGFSGPDAVNAGVSYTYSIPGNSGSTYSWSVPAGATIIDDHGNSIAVVFNSGASGTITVIETNVYGTATANLSVHVNTATSIGSGKLSSANYAFYPNPFSEGVRIKILSTNTVKLKLRITDIEGKTVYTSNEFYTNQEILINESLPVGVLVVEVNYGNDINVFKIVKQ